MKETIIALIATLTLFGNSIGNFQEEEPILGVAPYIFTISQGGTKSSSFSPNSVLVSGTTTLGALTASSSPSFGYLIATSTTATSTIQGGLKITGGGLTSSTLTGCDTIDTDSSGNLTCGSDATGAGGGDFAWTPTTWGGVLANSTTTLIQFLAGSVSATSSIGTLTSGAVTATSSLTVPSLTSALTLTGAGGLFAEYTGTSCTNQFPRSLSALGVATCASVDLANDITGTLTIANGGTNATAFSPHTLVAYNGTSLVSTSTIAFQSFVATSTTATSTIAGGFTAGNNAAFSVNRGATANSLYVAENGSIGIGTANPTGVLNLSDNSLSTVNIDTYSNTLTNNSQVVFRKSRGTAGTPLAIGSGDRLWEFYGQGHNGTSFAVTETARLMSVANGAINGARIPAYIRFDTSDGTNDMAERMRIDENGKLGIGTTSPTSLFSVHGNAYFSGDITNVSSITATGTLTVTPLTSALVLTGAGGSFAEYGGAAACTNQFVTALSVLGATTCASINNDQWSGTDLSVANGGTGASTLTGILQGNGTSAFTASSTLGFNLFPDEWLRNSGDIGTGVYDFGGATSLELPNGASPTVDTTGEIAIDTTTGQLKWSYNDTTLGVQPPFHTLSFNVSSSTWGAGTTTIGLGPAKAAITVVNVACETSAGTLGVSLYDGTNRADYIRTASTTINTFVYATNNTFTANESIRVDVGTAASAPTWIACRFRYTYDQD